VLIDFWTYSCINCLRSIPYVRAWAEKYKGQGLVVIGVHAPEFAFEKSIDNVRRATQDLKKRLPGRDRQRLCHLACLRQSILAGTLFHRWGRTHPLPPFRRRRIRPFGAGYPATAGGIRQK